MHKEAKVKFYQRPDGLWGWKLIAANGRNVGPGGEGFASKSNAVRAWETHVRIVLDFSDAYYDKN